MKKHIVCLKLFLFISVSILFYLKSKFYFFSVVSAEERELISTTVARIGKRVVTSREVQISFFIERALYFPKQLESASILDVQSPIFMRELNLNLLEWVVFLEAQSFAAHEISTKELEDIENNGLSLLVKNGPWKSLNVSRAELRIHLEKKLRAKKFVESKVKNSTVQVTDSESRDYFESHRAKFGNLPFNDLKNNIRSYLSRQQVDQRLRDWLTVLQEKYKVNNMLIN